MEYNWLPVKDAQDNKQVYLYMINTKNIYENIFVKRLNEPKVKKVSHKCFNLVSNLKWDKNMNEAVEKITNGSRR